MAFLRFRGFMEPRVYFTENYDSIDGVWVKMRDLPEATSDVVFTTEGFESIPIPDDLEQLRDIGIHIHVYGEPFVLYAKECEDAQMAIELWSQCYVGEFNNKQEVMRALMKRLQLGERASEAFGVWASWVAFLVRHGVRSHRNGRYISARGEKWQAVPVRQCCGKLGNNSVDFVNHKAYY